MVIELPGIGINRVAIVDADAKLKNGQKLIPLIVLSELDKNPNAKYITTYLLKQ
jgi:hypothetical protein